MVRGIPKESKLMAHDSKETVQEAHREVAALLARVAAQRFKQERSGVRSASRLRNRGAAISDPSHYWAGTLQSSEGADIEEVAVSLQLAAAKMKAGDLSFVYESGLGQVAWLSTVAIELKADADELPLDSAKRARLIELSMRAQNAAAKLMLSLGALAKLRTENSILLESES